MRTLRVDFRCHQPQHTPMVSSFAAEAYFVIVSHIVRLWFQLQSIGAFQREHSSLPNQKWQKLATVGLGQSLCSLIYANPLGKNKMKRAEKKLKGRVWMQFKWRRWQSQQQKFEGGGRRALIFLTAEVWVHAEWGPQSACRCSWWKPSPCTWSPSAPLLMVRLKRKRTTKWLKA